MQDRRGALAVEVWVRSIACGALLGMAGAVLTVTPALLAGTEPVGALLLIYFAAIVGNVYGFIVGNLVGVPLGLLVMFGHRRLGARVVATLMPLTALLVTQPLTYAVFRSASTAAVVAMLLLDALFTVLGARWIARRYRQLAPRYLPVH